ncbi:MAG: amino acid permease [Chlamydiae bacterium CG10_big_fil_rev_8_21_14_0_10_42_34]|nr:MAG: amino acid permease [Chlamydiae bacterium CG10_big_fil_rev_8_21_14_0_10_42_34]
MFKKKALTASMIALINVCAICNIKNFPLLAEYGLSVIFFLVLSSIFYLIPVALVSSELASAWPERGVYTWVKEALGPRLGFLAIWLEWIENVIWYPTILSFIASTFAYIFNPDLANSKVYVMSAILITFWAMTFVNFLGMRVSGWISSIAALFGTIIPIVLIIFMGVFWIAGGHPLQIEFSYKALVPDLSSVNQLVLLSGVLLGLAGMEMSAVHAKEVQNPQRDYPRGILLSTILIIVFSILGSLAIAAIVPNKEIQLASGGMEAFRYLFAAFNMQWAMPIIAAITTFGALGMMSTWIVGPSRGLYATAEHGDLPPIFHKTNKHNMPVNILITQAMIVTVLSFVFLFMPSVNSSYWALVALASLLYMIMYILMFIAGLVLRYKYPRTLRVFKIPYGNVGIWIVSILGIIGSSFGVIISFFPPSQIDTGSLIILEVFLISATLIFCIAPLLIFAARKAHWLKK